MQGKLKYQESRTPNTLSPQEEFIMFCQEMSDTK